MFATDTFFLRAGASVVSADSEGTSDVTTLFATDTFFLRAGAACTDSTSSPALPELFAGFFTTDFFLVRTGAASAASAASSTNASSDNLESYSVSQSYADSLLRHPVAIPSAALVVDFSKIK